MTRRRGAPRIRPPSRGSAAGQPTGQTRNTSPNDDWGMSTQTPARDGTSMLTPAEAARIANVSRDTIYREIDRGALGALYVGRQLRIDPDAFRRYLDRSGSS